MTVTKREPVIKSTIRITPRAYGSCIAVTVLLWGCSSEPVTTQPLLKKQQQEPVATIRSPTLPEASIEAPLERAQVDDFCRLIVTAGGAIRYDQQGFPVEVDLVAGRASADSAVLESALALVDLKALSVGAGQLDAAQLSRIGSLKQLQALMLQDAAIDDSALKAILLGCSDLRRLTLRNTSGLSQAGLTKLSSLPQLTHLGLIEMQMPAVSLTMIAHLPTLVSLDLRMSSGIDSASLANLSAAEHLRELKLAGHDIDNTVLQVAATVPHLEHLTIEDAPIDGNGLSAFAQSNDAARRIRSLALTRCASMTDDGLQHLASFGNLERLVLRDVPITGVFLKALPEKDNLESLALNQTFLVEEAFDEIKSCENLRRLELSQNFLSPTAMNKIASLTHLEYLNLTDCALNDELLDALSPLENLTTLIIDGNPDVSPEKVSALLKR